jgi:predicted AAA+ superfamily ATPase
MFHRIPKLSKTNSFFLFGPRGSGKSTLLREFFNDEHVLYIDLLSDISEQRYSKNPDLIISDAIASKKEWIIIDEIQKIPKLLDLVHKGIVDHKLKFSLTGSSARKLKRQGVNMLAGRAFIFYLFPLVSEELADQFDLQSVLSWGSLPQIFSYQSLEDKKNFLISYVKTYLKEEILIEQVVRNVEGFRDFLEIAAQMSGKVVNFSKIARECGVDPKTVKEFFQILEDTLVGHWVPGFHQSVRKSQKFQPKFYLFDVGVQRAIEGSLESAPVPGTSLYGQYFENYVVGEIIKMNLYTQKDFKVSHYQTTSNTEIDLVLTKGQKKILIEIKSSDKIDIKNVEAFERTASVFKGAQKYYLSRDPTPSLIGTINCIFYRDFFLKIKEF